MSTNPSQLLDELEKLPASERQSFLERHERDMIGVTGDPQLSQRLQQIMSSNGTQ